MGRAWVSRKQLKSYGMLGMNCRNVDFINRYIKSVVMVNTLKI